ncbi:hypothetical protein ACGK9U_03580 [Mariniflexile sp. HNIBRBA6329]|uniref:hypothetical protein n=1 Tax=Mariniflexile sp. HNIBRBA6329 TaxID=3373088 RepID=UPI0037477FDA
MKYLYQINKWLILINLLLFIIPIYGFMFLILTGVIQIVLAVVIAFNINKLEANGKILFLIYIVFTSIILFLTFITHNEKLYFGNITFIVVMVISLLLALLHLKITYLLFKKANHETN